MESYNETYKRLKAELLEAINTNGVFHKETQNTWINNWNANEDLIMGKFSKGELEGVDISHTTTMFDITTWVCTKKVTNEDNTPCCPKCKSKKIHSVDNETLYHPTNEDLKDFNGWRFDNELYMKFKCDEDTCKDEEPFTLVFNLILKK